MHLSTPNYYMQLGALDIKEVYYEIIWSLNALIIDQKWLIWELTMR